MNWGIALAHLHQDDAIRSDLKPSSTRLSKVAFAKLYDRKNALVVAVARTDCTTTSCTPMNIGA